MDVTIHFQPEGQDLQFFPVLKCSKFWRKAFTGREEIKSCTREQEIAINRISHLYCLAL